MIQRGLKFCAFRYSSGFAPLHARFRCFVRSSLRYGRRCLGGLRREALWINVGGAFSEVTRTSISAIEAARKIVFDRFHIARNACDAENAMRLAEHQALLA